MCTPVNPSFFYIKVGLRGSKLYRHDFVIYIYIVSFRDICRKTSYKQLNLNNSNTDGSFTTTNSNPFFSPDVILQIAQGN